MCIYLKNSNYTQFWEILQGELKSYFTITYYFIVSIKFINSIPKVFVQLKGGRVNQKY